MSMDSTQTWNDLDYWKSKEWQIVDERLKDLTQNKKLWCPGRDRLFAALEATPFDQVKAVICGQDPYPNPAYACGLAFSVPPSATVLPPSLGNILKEAMADVEGFVPVNGDLSPWAKKGVLLWNAIPSCDAWLSKSHHWPEWEPLTAEIFRRLSSKMIPFAFLGSTAQHYAKYVDEDQCDIIFTAHPSPRNNFKPFLNKPFRGSRLFSTINDKLQEQGKDPIDWRLT